MISNNFSSKKFIIHFTTPYPPIFLKNAEIAGANGGSISKYNFDVNRVFGRIEVFLSNVAF